MSEQEQPLSGQQLAALQKQMAATIDRILRDVELRKLALDQACKMAGTGNPVELAKLMHEFLTAPAVETNCAG